MAIPYKQTCSICRKIFFTKFRGQKICSKDCRRTIKKVSKYRKCIICGWDATIDIHHEDGKEFNLCPNHHSLITRGKQNLQETLSGVVRSLTKIEHSICPIIRKHNLLFYCPIINGSYKLKLLPHIAITKSTNSNFLYQKLKEANIKEFTCKEAEKIIGWKYERTKKHILNLIKNNKIQYSKKGAGGKGKRSIFKLI